MQGYRVWCVLLEVLQCVAVWGLVAREVRSNLRCVVDGCEVLEELAVTMGRDPWPMVRDYLRGVRGLG